MSNLLMMHKNNSGTILRLKPISLCATLSLILVSIGCNKTSTSKEEEVDNSNEPQVVLSEDQIKERKSALKKIEIAPADNIYSYLRPPTVIPTSFLPVGLTDQVDALKPASLKSIVRKSIPKGRFTKEGVQSYLSVYATGSSTSFTENGIAVGNLQGIVIEVRLLTRGIIRQKNGTFDPVMVELASSYKLISGNSISSDSIKNHLTAICNDLFVSLNHHSAKAQQRKYSYELNKADLLSYLDASRSFLTSDMRTLSSILGEKNTQTNVAPRDSQMFPPKGNVFDPDNSSFNIKFDAPWMSSMSLRSIVLGGGQEAPQPQDIWTAALPAIFKNPEFNLHDPTIEYSLHSDHLGSYWGKPRAHLVSRLSIKHPKVLIPVKGKIIHTQAGIYSRVTTNIGLANDRNTLEDIIRSDALTFAKGLKSGNLWGNKDLTNRELIVAIGKEYDAEREKDIMKILPHVTKWVEGKREFPVSNSITQQYARHISEKLIKHFPNASGENSVFFYGKRGNRKFTLTQVAHKSFEEKYSSWGKATRFIKESQPKKSILTSVYPYMFGEGSSQTEQGRFSPDMTKLLRDAPLNPRGTLRSAKVIDLHAYLMKKLWYESNRLEIAKVLKQYETQLFKAKLLTLEYSSKDGSDHYYIQRCAWYGVKPSFWDDLSKQLDHEKLEYTKTYLAGPPILSPHFTVDEFDKAISKQTEPVGTSDVISGKLTTGLQSATSGALFNDLGAADIFYAQLRELSKRSLKPVRSLPNYAAAALDEGVERGLPSALLLKAETHIEWNGKAYHITHGNERQVYDYLKKASKFGCGQAYYWLAELALAGQIRGGKDSAMNFLKSGINHGDESCVALNLLLYLEERGKLGKSSPDEKREALLKLKPGLRIGDPLSMYIYFINGSKKYPYHGLGRAALLGSGRAHSK